MTQVQSNISKAKTPNAINSTNYSPSCQAVERARAAIAKAEGRA